MKIAVILLVIAALCKGAASKYNRNRPLICPLSADEPMTHDTGEDCVKSCVGLTNGAYQSCKGCDIYVECYEGRIYDNQPCVTDLVFDNNLHTCSYQSSTCEDIKPKNGFFYMNHTESNMGNTGTEFTLINGTADPSCNAFTSYLFTPPACLRRVEVMLNIQQEQVSAYDFIIGEGSQYSYNTIIGKSMLYKEGDSDYVQIMSSLPPMNVISSIQAELYKTTSCYAIQKGMVMTSGQFAHQSVEKKGLFANMETDGNMVMSINNAGFAGICSISVKWTC